MPIRVLDPVTAARIAAGEVVERPASVVKELVENAVDAGARRIEVSVRGELTTSIMVVDDGDGIAPDELSLALARHATSKLPSGDISSIATLGFRGEALPSIASVAEVRVVSRAVGFDVALEVKATGDSVSQPRPVAHPQGTRVEVRDLFSLVPARLKFLKSKRTEMAAVREVIDNAALAFPDVEFRLTTSGPDVVYRPAGNRRDPESVARRAKDVLGEAFMRDGITVAAERGGIQVRGVACLPTRTRKDANGIIVAVNGRPINDRGIVSAVKAAYSGMVAPGTLPLAFVSVSLPPDRIDVNVHPRKSEVRFADPSEVHAAVTEAIGACLGGAGLRTSARLADMASDLAAANPFDAGDRRRFPLGRFIGQANGSWLVAETMDGIVIVDQHAAHERVVLERLRASFGRGAGEALELPTPSVVLLRPGELAALHERADGLGRLGLRIDFLPGAAHVHSVPAVLGPVDVTALVSDLAAAAVDDPSADVVGERLLEMMATAGCRAAIKAGDELTPERADVLLREMEATPNASTCNHGRPVVAFLTSADLERLFARR